MACKSSLGASELCAEYADTDPGIPVSSYSPWLFLNCPPSLRSTSVGYWSSPAKVAWEREGDEQEAVYRDPREDRGQLVLSQITCIYV